MKKHTKIYFDFFRYDNSDFITCEACDKYRAVDIHHIEARGMGGSNTKDHIDNLMGLCRECHERYGDKKDWKEWLTKVHMLKVNRVRK